MLPMSNGPVLYLAYDFLRTSLQNKLTWLAFLLLPQLCLPFRVLWSLLSFFQGKQITGIGLVWAVCAVCFHFSSIGVDLEDLVDASADPFFGGSRAVAQHG